MAVERVERPQRRLRAGGLQLAVQLDLQRPRKQHVAGHADDDGVGGDPLEQRAPSAARSVADRAAIDRLAEQQERLDREALGEAPAVVLEILGDRRPFEAGLELAEAGVELVAAAIGEHAELARAAHAGGDVAVADGRRAPARAAGAASPCPSRRAAGPPRWRSAARSARGGAPRTPRRPCRRGWRRRRSPASCSRSRRATPPPGRRGRAPRSPAAARPSSKPRQVEPLPGQHGQSTVMRAGSMRSGAKSAGHHGSRAALRVAPAVAERKRRRGDAADDHDHRRRAQLRAIGPPAEVHVLERMAVDGDGGTVDVEAAGDDGGQQGLGHAQATSLHHAATYLHSMDILAARGWGLGTSGWKSAAVALATAASQRTNAPGGANACRRPAPSRSVPSPSRQAA